MPKHSSQTLFQKLAVYIGSNLKQLIDRSSGERPSPVEWFCAETRQIHTSSAYTRIAYTMSPSRF
jgi:hypothetical protein